jgi:hypothetical protein
MLSPIRGSFIRWWVIVILQSLSLAIAVYFGAIEEIWLNDQTKLSFVILAIWAVSTLSIGYWHLARNKSRVNYMTKIGWFLSETCMAIGMIGTVIGFLLMLGSAFGNINVADTASLQTALKFMALGMSTALYTTLVGLVCGLYIKSQLVNLEHSLDRKNVLER